MTGSRHRRRMRILPERSVLERQTSLLSGVVVSAGGEEVKAEKQAFLQQKGRVYNRYMAMWSK